MSVRNNCCEVSVECAMLSAPIKVSVLRIRLGVGRAGTMRGRGIIMFPSRIRVGIRIIASRRGMSNILEWDGNVFRLRVATVGV